MTVQREKLEADVLIVGAGPAGLSCALHLANLIKKHNESSGAGKNGPQLSAETIYVLEKGREIGAHQLSGAIMNPKALAELVPGFEKSAPLDTPVTDSAALLFTKNSSFRFPITPPPFQNKGNYVVSLSKMTKWLGGLVEAAGVNVFKEFGGAELVYQGEGIAGVITEDKGLDKTGKPKDNFTPGYELRAKVAVLRRLVRDAAELSRRRADYRRLGKFSRFAEAKGHSPCDEERDAGRRNDFRCAEGGRYFLENSERLPKKNRAELHQKRIMARAEFSSIVPAWNVPRICSHRIPANDRRTRIDRSHAGACGSRSL